MAFLLICKEKVLSKKLELRIHWLRLTMERPVAQEESKSQGHLLLICEARIH